MRGSLLWVYEGMDQCGATCCRRAPGLEPSAGRWILGDDGPRPTNIGVGRDWRSVADTTGASSFRPPSGAVAAAGSATSYYSEGALVWLDAVR
ncbi:MAG: hypothetical protein R3C16_10060 [Hyphomonadaceae bacterium]